MRGDFWGAPGSNYQDLARFRERHIPKLPPVPLSNIANVITLLLLGKVVLESPLRWMEIAHDQPPPYTPFQKYWNSEVESFIFVVN